MFSEAPLNDNSNRLIIRVWRGFLTRRLKCVDSPLDVLSDEPEEEQSRRKHSRSLFQISPEFRSQPPEYRYAHGSQVERSALLLPVCLRRWTTTTTAAAAAAAPPPVLRHHSQATKAENQFPHIQNKGILLPVSVSLICMLNYSKRVIMYTYCGARHWI